MLFLTSDDNSDDFGINKAAIKKLIFLKFYLFCGCGIGLRGFSFEGDSS